MNEVILGIFGFVVIIFLWIILAVLMVLAFGLFFAGPYLLFELICYVTVNNIINMVARIPIIGWLIAFILTCFVSMITASVSLCCSFMSLIGPAIWCVVGVPEGKSVLIEDCAYVLESVRPLQCIGLDWNLNPAYWFMECFEWIYKYSGMCYSICPWHDTVDVFESGGLFLFIMKMTIFAIPWTIIVILPFIFVIWNFTRPIVGTTGRLPAIMDKFID